MKKTTVILLLAALLCACGGDESRWARASSWFETGKQTDTTLVDMFYVLPSCLFDWTDSHGELRHYGDFYFAEQRTAVRPSCELACEIFGEKANMFIPYYSQLTLEPWLYSADSLEMMLRPAMDDLKDAFAYYLAHENAGRPFALAGFSQGGRGVVELLRDMPDSVAQRCVAAYCVGYRITADDLSHMPSCMKANPEPAKWGALISYNTVTRPEAIFANVTDGAAFCTNPVVMCVTTEPTMTKDGVSIIQDTLRNVLIASGVDEGDYFRPELERWFPMGNLHLYELTLYQTYLHDDFLRRMD